MILYPEGRTSEVQRRQMTTVDSPNVHAVAIEGTFDDCQDLVKAMFADAAFRDELRLSAVNSINWARVMAQIVYYVTALACARGADHGCACRRGNFGNVLSGWIARRMGAPIDDFIVASNANDILARFVNDGDMSTREVVPTLSPSMDIQVSSNFERLLFEINGRDGGMTAEQLGAIPRHRHARDRGRPARRVHHGSFRAARCDDAATLAEIGRVYAETGILIDPHTATGTARRPAARAGPGRTLPVVTLATAHPAKFPDAVERATGVRPAAAGPPGRPASTAPSAPRRCPTIWPLCRSSCARCRPRADRAPRRPCDTGTAHLFGLRCTERARTRYSGRHLGFPGSHSATR